MYVEDRRVYGYRDSTNGVGISILFNHGWTRIHTDEEGRTGTRPELREGVRQLYSSSPDLGRHESEWSNCLVMWAEERSQRAAG